MIDSDRCYAMKCVFILSGDFRKKNVVTPIHAGYYVDAACVAALNPYGTKDFERFGKYTLSLAVVPDPVDYAATIVSDVPNATTVSTA